MKMDGGNNMRRRSEEEEEEGVRETRGVGY